MRVTQPYVAYAAYPLNIDNYIHILCLYTLLPETGVSFVAQISWRIRTNLWWNWNVFLDYLEWQVCSLTPPRISIRNIEKGPSQSNLIEVVVGASC